MKSMPVSVFFLAPLSVLFTPLTPICFAPVAVDVKGDVYQWGDGFVPSSTQSSPRARISLRGMDIYRIAAADQKIYALSRKGQVWVFPADRERQTSHSEPREKSSWWSLFSGKPTHAENLVTDTKLGSGERSVRFHCLTQAANPMGRVDLSPSLLAPTTYSR